MYVIVNLFFNDIMYSNIFSQIMFFKENYVMDLDPDLNM